ncbi:cysteine proteinase, partial [Acaromyces ingoldii]
GQISAIPGAGVRDHDIQKLRPSTWLNDEVINFYMRLIQLRSDLAVTRRKEQSKKWRAFWDVHIFNSYFWQKFSSQGYAGVSKWTRRVDIFKKDLVLIPINMNDTHWICAAINLRRRRFELYDSMATSHATGSTFFRKLRQYLAAEYCDKKGKSSADDLFLDDSWTDHFSEESPQQANGSDCGVFATMTLEQLSRRDPTTGDAGEDEDEEWNFSQGNMLYLRRRMVYEIA